MNVIEVKFLIQSIWSIEVVVFKFTFTEIDYIEYVKNKKECYGKGLKNLDVGVF